MHSWNVHIKNPLQWAAVPPLLISAVKDSFVHRGFDIIPVVSLYYNPTTRNRFTVTHTRESAMTAWILQYAGQFNTVEITAHATDQ